MSQETSNENKSPGEAVKESALERHVRSLSQSLQRSDRSIPSIPSIPSSTSSSTKSGGIPTSLISNLEQFDLKDSTVLLEPIPIRNISRVPFAEELQKRTITQRNLELEFENLETFGVSKDQIEKPLEIEEIEEFSVGTVTMNETKWRTSTRTDEEIKKAYVITSGEDRAKLDAKALNFLQREATLLLDKPFRFMSTGVENDYHLINSYNLSLQIASLKKRCREHDTIGAFNVFVTPVGAPVSPMLTVVNLLNDNEKSNRITLADVKAMVTFKRRYGPEYHLQDLAWTQTKLDKSCDSNLRQKIVEKCPVSGRVSVEVQYISTS